MKTERWHGLMAQQAKAAGQDLETYVRERSQELPLGRIALPEEVADVVCFLASERASFLTGITITVDSGITRGVYL
ncbi:MAG TPA: SDR family oxidoreductase [Methylomirabilota bacterium]|nr:SDR family oxidoreductase [Methylomirabilota bacterium]